MSQNKSKFWYSNNCLHFSMCAVPFMPAWVPLSNQNHRSLVCPLLGYGILARFLHCTLATSPCLIHFMDLGDPFSTSFSLQLEHELDKLECLTTLGCKGFAWHRHKLKRKLSIANTAPASCVYIRLFSV